MNRISRSKFGFLLFFIKLVVITVFCKLCSVNGLYSSNGFIISSGEYIAVCDENNYKNNRTCCENGEFQCIGACIPSDKVCNSDGSFLPLNHLNDVECIDLSDELGCSSAACASRRDMCPQECIDLPNRESKCSCYKGYHLRTRDFHTTCEDIDECAIGLHSCSHDCKNLNGTFECSCRDGFQKDSNKSNECHINDTNTVVLFYEWDWISGHNLTSGIRTLIVRSGKIKSMDYDPDKNMLYWSNSTSVTRSYLPGAETGTGTVTSAYPQVVSEFNDDIERDSLAIDWTAGNLYWLSSDTFNESVSQIMVSKLDGRYVKTLIEIPRASSLVLDPEFGRMYWACGGDDPHIGSAQMNGKVRSTLVRLPNQNPIALTLDHLSNGRLYWVDSIHHTINCVFKFGSRTRKVYTTTPEQSPISLDVFENNLYWVTKESEELLTIDKFGKGEVKSLLPYMADDSLVKVYHKKKIEKKARPRDVIYNDQCSHLLLRKPGGYTCACPDTTSRVVPIGGKMVCDNEILEPMEDPLDCNCDNKELVSNTSSPYSQCPCGIYNYDSEVNSYNIITHLPIPLFLGGIVVALVIVATILSFFKKANI